MATVFKKKPVKFTLKDVGSNVIDQISSDIYTTGGAIIRELVKNAYDSYLKLDNDEFEDKTYERDIVISRERDEKGVGRLLVADNGIGLSFDDLKALVQISISNKPQDLDNATGFRGLGSWAILGAGSKVIIRSIKKDHPYESKLTMDVRQIYSHMGVTTTLDDILNNPKCIYFEEGDNSESPHGTVVEIVCDGEPCLVNGYEINRLYAYTDPANGDLRNLLIQTCPIPFPSEGGAYKKIHEIYSESGYVPTNVFLDGDPLVKGLPADLPEPEIHEILIGSKVAAKAWVTSGPGYTGEVRGIDETKHLLGGSSIQLMKLNVPVGPKAIYSNGVVRATIPNWFIGEVHIMLPDIKPDAGGQDLRQGTTREAFKVALQQFYRKLQEQAERKSDILSTRKALQAGIDAANAITDGKVKNAQDRAQAEANIAIAVALIDDTSSRKKPKNNKEERLRTVAKSPEVAKVRTEAGKLFKQTEWYDKFSQKPQQKRTRGKKPPVGGNASKRSASSNGSKPQHLLSYEIFQSRIGRAFPRFTAIGLSQEQIEQVIEIINEVVFVDASLVEIQ
jgi:hypothetical protein